MCAAEAADMSGSWSALLHECSLEYRKSTYYITRTRVALRCAGKLNSYEMVCGRAALLYTSIALHLSFIPAYTRELTITN